MKLLLLLSALLAGLTGANPDRMPLDARARASIVGAASQLCGEDQPAAAQAVMAMPRPRAHCPEAPQAFRDAPVVPAFPRSNDRRLE